MSPRSLQTTNTLLRALSSEDFALLETGLTRVALAKSDALVTPDARVEHVYFPEDGIISTISVSAPNNPIDTGIFGREGVSATCLLLGSDRSPYQSLVQVEGLSALRIETSQYLATIMRSESLRIMLLRYVQTVVVQTAHNTATNAHCRVEARLARWLLMCHDRIEGDEIAITHEVLGVMISAERSSVRITLHILEGAGMIRSLQCRIVIRDRQKLEELAGDCYGTPEAEYRRLIGPIGRSSNVLPFKA